MLSWEDGGKGVRRWSKKQELLIFPLAPNTLGAARCLAAGLTPQGAQEH